MAKLLVRRKAHKRKSYIRKGGIRVKASRVPSSSFKVKDRGKKGRTPKSKQWFEPTVHTGWDKDMAMGTRRSKVLRAHKGNLLSSGRSMQALSNVSTDRKTKVSAKADATYFFKKLHKM